MNIQPAKISLDEWDANYVRLANSGTREAAYGGPLRRHVDDGDLRLMKLKYDNSAAALRLWNLLLSEEDRLHEARLCGRKIVGTMKDLGTVPVMAYSLPDVTAFYPDGAWWTPCVMQMSDGLMAVADSMGVDESFCPVRAMLGAFATQAHFPIPDLLICSVGAICDDFSAIAQRLNGMGHPILWWEIPHRREPDPGEPAVSLPGGLAAPSSQVDFVEEELRRVRHALESISDFQLSDSALTEGVETANRARRLLAELRRLVFTADVCPMPALEMQIAEMLTIHFCSDRDETIGVYEDLLAEVRRRVSDGTGVLSRDAVRVFWVNPVADLRVMNLLESCGGRICGTDYMFTHALDEIPTDLPPMEALARSALADPMVGTSRQRAARVCTDIEAFGAEAVIISRIPGASHCATEGKLMGDIMQANLGLPILEIEVPPIVDSMMPALTTRIEALIERGLENRR